MYTTQRTIAVLLILAAVLLSAGCSQLGTDRSSCDGQYPVRSAAAGSYQVGSSPQKFSYVVDADISVTRLRLVFDHTEGGMSWTFTDPLGEVRWEGEHGQAALFGETRDFDPVQGEWRLEIDARDGSGSYDHCWMAR